MQSPMFRMQSAAFLLKSGGLTSCNLQSSPNDFSSMLAERIVFAAPVLADSLNFRLSISCNGALRLDGLHTVDLSSFHPLLVGNHYQAQ